MQENQDGGGDGAAAEGTHSSGGVDKSPDRVSIFVPGVQYELGWGLNLVTSSVTTRFGGKQVQWLRLLFPEFHLSHGAQMLILHGQKIGQLFPPDAQLVHRAGVLLTGPFTFLAGERPNPHTPTLRNLILAKTPPLPVKAEDFLSALGALLTDSNRTAS